MKFAYKKVRRLVHPLPPTYTSSSQHLHNIFTTSSHQIQQASSSSVFSLNRKMCFNTGPLLPDSTLHISVTLRLSSPSGVVMRFCTTIKSIVVRSWTSMPWFFILISASRSEEHTSELQS